MQTPVTVLGGYLGSGKTTLVNQLLRQADGLRLAILVNDFGDLAIDADLIEADDGDVISLSGGCVCCSYGNDLASVLVNFQALDTRPDHIVIEASGVALPGAIGGILSLLQGLRLDGIIVVVDTSTIIKTANDKYLSDTIERQFESADVVLLNKRDLASASDYARVRGYLSDNYPVARIVDSVQASVPIDLILGSFNPGNMSVTSSVETTHNASIFTSIEIKLDGVHDASLIAELLSDPRCSLLRAKGFVLDTDDRLKTIQVVGNRWSVTEAPENVSTGLVCIGKIGEFSEISVLSHLALG